MADRAQVDKIYLRAQQAAPQWVYPLLAYQHALHPNWHGRPNERTQFITNLEKEHPKHRALPYLWAAEYALAASDALADQNYGQGMVQAEFALERNSKNASAWESKGRAFLGVQRSPEGLRALSRAIELNPFSDSAYTARGIARFNAGETGGQEDYVQAALLGDSWALKTVFWNLLSGKTPGVPQDQAQLPILCNRLQTVGVPDSIFCMATVYYFGYGVPQDVKKGFELMRLAADQGEADAMSDVGKIYWQGNAAAGVARDKEQALRYWLRAASIGSDRALVELSQVKNDLELPQLINKIRNEQREANAIVPK